MAFNLRGKKGIGIAWVFFFNLVSLTFIADFGHLARIF